MFSFANIDSPVARSLSGLAGNDISRRIRSAHAADTGGIGISTVSRNRRILAMTKITSIVSPRHNRFDIALLLAAVLASLSGVATARSQDTPQYWMTGSSTAQTFATETFNGELARYTRLQPSSPGAMQVRLRVIHGSIGGFNFWQDGDPQPSPMRAHITYCLTNQAEFGRSLRDGGEAARNRNDGDIVNRGGREVEVMRFGDFEFVNSDRDRDNIDLQLLYGREEGHSCVALQVIINSTDNFFTYSMHTIETGDEIIFNIPSIKNAHALADPDQSIGVMVEMRGIARDGYYENRSIQRNGEYFREDFNFGNPVPIARSAPALQLSLRHGRTHSVSEENSRLFERDFGMNGRQAPIANLNLLERGGIQYTSNGRKDFDLMDPHSNRHRLRVTATGLFNPGDRVFLDFNGDRRISGGEEFRFNADRTVATGTFNHRSPVVNRPIYFVASNDHDIRAGDYSVHATYDFDYRSYKDVVSNRISSRINGRESTLQLRQTASATVYATEVFGEGSAETVLHARGMSTTLTALGTTGGGSSRLRFELEAPAVFGADIQASHLAAANSDVSVVSGTGTAGSRTVEFNVNADSGFVAAGSAFTFNIPSVRNAGSLAEAGGTIGVAASIARGNDEFSGESISVNSTVVATSAPGFVFSLGMPDSDDMGDLDDTDSMDDMDDTDDMSSMDVTDDMDDMGDIRSTGVIDPDNPGTLIGDPNVDTDSDGVNDTRALMLGTLVLYRSEGDQHDHDGGDIPIRDVDEVILKVQGLLPDDSGQVFIDLDGDRHVGQGEAFATVDEDDDDYPAVTLTLTGPGAATEAGGAHVYYVPGGTESLAATTYTLTADYEFGRTDGEAENYRALVLTSESSVMETADDATDGEVIAPVTVGRF